MSDAETHSNSASYSQTQPFVGRRRPWIWLPWVLTLFLLIAVGITRYTGPWLDFAVANIVTAGLLILIWGLATLGAYTTFQSRVIWPVLLFSPFLVLGVFLSIFRFERLDGDLKPQFVLRWQEAASLPSSIDPRSTPTTAGLWSPRNSDFPQFLGGNRDGSVSGADLNPDWLTHPPAIAWKQPIGDGWSGFAVQGDLAVTMEQRDTSECVTAYSMLDGRLIWKYEIDALHTNVLGGTGPRSTPAIFENRVYACSAVSQFVCLELATGEKIWSQELLGLGKLEQDEFETSVAWGRAASPVIVDQAVVIPLGGAKNNLHTLIAFNTMTGQELWRTGQDQISYSSPSIATLDGVRQLLLISEQQIAAYHLEDGNQLWAFPWSGSSNGAATVSQPIPIDANHILLTKGYGEGAELIEVKNNANQWTVSSVWKNPRVLKTKFTSCVIHQGFAYGLSDGILECVQLETGERQWKKGRYRQGQLLLVDNFLLVSSEDGEVILVAADPTDWTELGRLPVIGDITWNTLTLSGNRLLIRNSDEAACVILPTFESSPDAEPDNHSTQIGSNE